MTDPRREVVIIGAGPAGLAAGAVLVEGGVDVTVLEREKVTGGAYARLWPGLKLLSPREFTWLPFEPWDHGKDGELVTSGEYREYLDRYVEKRKIPVSLGVSVSGVRAVDGGYEVATSQGVLQAKNVIHATGMISFPKPVAHDPEANPGIEFHTGVTFRGPAHYRGKSVLVSGSGTSAVELAVELAGIAREVHLSVKGKLKTFPEVLLGVNIHYWVQHLEKLPRWMFRSFCVGTFKEPAADTGIRDAIRAGRVQVHGHQFTLKDGIAEFSEGPTLKIDSLITATGYRFDTGVLPPDVERLPNGRVLTRNCESVSHPGLFLIGHPCAGSVASAFLRGMRQDAHRILRKIRPKG